jgi:hypothetical protein
MRPLQLDSESRLLIATVNGRIWRSTVPWILEQKDHLDWTRVVALAVRERAESVLWDRLRVLPSGTVPMEVARSLAPLAQATTFSMLFLENRLTDALRVLARERVPVTLLGGTALASIAYPYFGARPMSDLELLIDPNHAVRAVRALGDAGWRLPETDGYEVYRHLIPLEDTGESGARLEVHTELTSAGSGFHLTGSLVGSRAVDMVVRSGLARIPCTTHLLLDLCIRFSWTRTMSRGIWRTLRDLDAVIVRAAVDWDELVGAAKAHNATTCCYWTFRLARRLAGIEVPLPVLHRLQPGRSERVLRRLERGFILEQFSSACPPVWMRHALWTLAIDPERTGHGRSRPWTRAQVQEPTPMPVSRRIVNHLRDMPRWKSFAVELIAGR